MKEAVLNFSLDNTCLNDIGVLQRAISERIEPIRDKYQNFSVEFSPNNGDNFVKQQFTVIIYAKPL